MSASMPSPHHIQPYGALHTRSTAAANSRHELGYDTDDGVYPLPSDSQGNTSSHSHHVSHYHWSLIQSARSFFLSSVAPYVSMVNIRY